MKKSIRNHVDLDSDQSRDQKRKHVELTFEISKILGQLDSNNHIQKFIPYENSLIIVKYNGIVELLNLDTGSSKILMGIQLDQEKKINERYETILDLFYSKENR